ncbi:hypothetical protein BJ875DRAFT_539335 [Amylocarpus encephaloides]|uniref:Uncharacterized protein n=1 Tax=Amylocarpus encephaloides TaxID=45428 RepID=A0A9P8C9C6_9HELO|nr:hypothetical protein BJ875DRAFT_539335 [Amylocarpus encephaloides]
MGEDPMMRGRERVRSLGEVMAMVMAKAKAMMVMEMGGFLVVYQSVRDLGQNGNASRSSKGAACKALSILSATCVVSRLETLPWLYLCTRAASGGVANGVVGVLRCTRTALWRRGCCCWWWLRAPAVVQELQDGGEEDASVHEARLFSTLRCLSLDLFVGKMVGFEAGVRARGEFPLEMAMQDERTSLAVQAEFLALKVFGGFFGCVRGAVRRLFQGWGDSV